MDEILKKLLKDKVLNEETMEAIKKSFQQSLTEARSELEKKVRSELAEQYESDKANIYKAMEQFLEQELAQHVAELREGVESVNKLKHAYAKKSASLKEAAQKYVRDRLRTMEAVIDRVLKKELKELHESEVTNRKAYLKAINDKTAILEAERQKFRQKGAAVLENIINVQVRKTMDELREDIKAAKQQNFGRELYEAFFTTFRRQFFDSRKEFQGVMKELKEARAETAQVRAKARKVLAEAKSRVELAEAARKKVEEAVTRKSKIAKLLEGLAGPAQSQMRTLLEATKTADLEKAFKKFLPEVAVRKAQDPKAKKLAETVVELKTGGNTPLVESRRTRDDDEIVEISRRAGVTK